MTWKLIERPKVVRVTKSLARQFAEMESAPHDRPLSERRLMVYQRLMAEGKFRPVTWAKAWCKETKGEYRVNGKHTSIMLSGMDKIPEFYINIEEYHCDTLEDVARLYGTFDSAMQSRTARDIYQSFAGTVDELKNLPIRVINSVPPGIGYALHGSDMYTRLQPAERAELLLEYPKFAMWVTDIVASGAKDITPRSSARSSHLLRQPVIAAMFMTYQKHAGESTTFWQLVRDETGETPDNPDRRLGRYLVLANMRGKSHTDSRQVKKNVTIREVYVRCLMAWNSWRSGNNGKMNYFADAKVPEVV